MKKSNQKNDLINRIFTDNFSSENGTSKTRSSGSDSDSDSSETSSINTLSQDKTLLPKSVAFGYPWLSTLASFFTLALLIVSNDQQLIDFYRLPPFLLTQNLPLILMALLGLVYLIDIQFFLARKNKIQQQITLLEKQLKFAWQRKSQQQQRANTFSGRTDKLKAFISDKLLESIEFDEKFLHFKGIASEVRHNGVISYDKVMTALSKAIQQQGFLAIYEAQDELECEVDLGASNDKMSPHANNPSQHTVNALTDYQTAIDAMHYLWVLLDLSTADNMSLHIGNQLIESEEQFYQLQLDTNRSMDATQSIPTNPTFYPQMAALMTFSLLCDEPEIREQISIAKINEAVLQDSFNFETPLYRIYLATTDSLLGNPNHIILLLENLIKNALFFNSKVSYKQKSDRVGIALMHAGDFVHFSIYNRGPHIEGELEKVFALGYTTRKNKQHHGKGLGLFFVNEIVKGYQGEIEASNIVNRHEQYQLIIELASYETRVYFIETQQIDGKIQSRINQTDNSSDNLEWQNEIKLEQTIPFISLQVKQLDSGQNEIDKQAIEIQSEAIEWLEPAENLQPKWHIQTKHSKRKHTLTFKGLDISGVCFNIKLPTAESCL